MRNILLIVGSVLSIYLVPADASELIRTEIDGQEYTCRPADKDLYCPRRAYDVPMNINISFERLSCLDTINKDGDLKQQIRECFLNPRLKKFFSDLQLYDVKASCLKENLKSCWDYHENCSSPPCGDLGSFINEARKRGFSQFEKSDGESACNSLIVL